LKWAKRYLTKSRSMAIKDRLCEWFATCSYVGRIPYAPGTWGSLLACLILFFVPASNNLIVVALLVLTGLVTAERARGVEKDPGRIVIDEYVGMAITMIGHNPTVWNLTKAFILFRAFDILKPYPIRKLERLPGATGIMADDVLAGIFANIFLLLWGRLLG
jgi:phosphatidylglycerophosphatase A